MADLAFGISKSAVQSLADKVRSAIKEEAEKWQIVQRDLVFIKGEFEMMQAFLDIGSAQHVKNSVGRTWVRQVHDLSYDTEDWMEFVLHLEPRRSGWLRRMLPSCMEAAAPPLDVAVDEIKHLKARVEDVSQRNLRYNLISDSGSNPVARMEQTLADSRRALDVFVKARDAEKDRAAVMQLKSLIMTEDRGLKVLSVCGIGGDLGTTSLVRQVYEDSEICSKFELRAWLKAQHDAFGYRLTFARDMALQLLANHEQGVNLRYLGRVADDNNQCTGERLDNLFNNNGRFLIVLEDVSSTALWDSFRVHLPENKNGSRIIVSTKALEIASLCTGRPYEVSVVREFSAGHSVCVFFKENERDSMDSGKEKELEDHIDATRRKDKGCVIFIWGRTGKARYDLVRTVYHSFRFNKKFDKYAWADRDSLHNIESLCKNLNKNLGGEIYPSVSGCRKSLHQHCCLVVIESLNSVHLWNSISQDLMPGTSRSCIVITSEHGLARECVESVENKELHFFEEEGLQYGCAMHIGEVPSMHNTDSNIGTLLSAQPFSDHEEYNTSECPRLLDIASNWMNNFHLYGRDSEVQIIKNRILDTCPHVLSIWGLPGVGKTALVRTIYYSCVVEGLFDKFAWVNASPKDKEFDIYEFCQNLYFDLCPTGRKCVNRHNTSKQLYEHRCLIVIDGLESEMHWDSIKVFLTASNLGPFPGQLSCIVVIARKESVAKRCAQKEEDLFLIDRLEAVDVRDFFSKSEKVHGDATSNSHCDMMEEDSLERKEMMEEYSTKKKDMTKEGSPKRKDMPEEASLQREDMMDQAEWIINECGRLPAIVLALRSYLAGKQDVLMEMKHLKANFMQVLEINPELGGLRDVLTQMHNSFNDCPQVNKKCTFYLSISPQSSIIRRRRLVRRWIAEGYSKGNDSSSMVDYTEKLFQKLADLGIIEPPPQALSTVSGDMKMTSCRVISMFLEYIISREKDEKILVPLEVSVLERACNINTERVGQHLVIRSSWKRDEIVLESLDLSRLRSLTVFGDWCPWFMSGRMRVLRVLDLEGTSNVKEEDLKKIGEFLPRLKFLSLRGCRDITRLPASIGDLGQLQTLDIRETSVVKVPNSIIKLRKLQYIRGGTMTWDYTGPVVRESAPEKKLQTTPVEEAATTVLISEVELPTQTPNREVLPRPSSIKDSEQSKPTEVVELTKPAPSAEKEQSPEPSAEIEETPAPSSKAKQRPLLNATEVKQAPLTPIAKKELPTQTPSGEVLPVSPPSSNEDSEQSKPAEVVDLTKPAPSAEKEQAPEPCAEIIEEVPSPSSEAKQRPPLPTAEVKKAPLTPTAKQELPTQASSGELLPVPPPSSNEEAEPSKPTEVVELTQPAPSTEREQSPEPSAEIEDTPVHSSEAKQRPPLPATQEPSGEVFPVTPPSSNEEVEQSKPTEVVELIKPEPTEVVGLTKPGPSTEKEQSPEPSAEREETPARSPEAKQRPPLPATEAKQAPLTPIPKQEMPNQAPSGEMLPVPPPSSNEEAEQSKPTEVVEITKPAPRAEKERSPEPSGETKEAPSPSSEQRPLAHTREDKQAPPAPSAEAVIQTPTPSVEAYQPQLPPALCAEEELAPAVPSVEAEQSPITPTAEAVLRPTAHSSETEQTTVQGELPTLARITVELQTQAHSGEALLLPSSSAEAKQPRLTAVVELPTQAHSTEQKQSPESNTNAETKQILLPPSQNISTC